MYDRLYVAISDSWSYFITDLTFFQQVVVQDEDAFGCAVPGQSFTAKLENPRKLWVRSIDAFRNLFLEWIKLLAKKRAVNWRPLLSTDGALFLCAYVFFPVSLFVDFYSTKKTRCCFFLNIINKLRNLNGFFFFFNDKYVISVKPNKTENSTKNVLLMNQFYINLISKKNK